MTFFFLVIIIGCTSKGAAAGFAGIPIGLGLTLIHLVSIPVTNTSVNPARSTGPALFAGGEYVGQLWLFWLAPIIGAGHRRTGHALASRVGRVALGTLLLQQTFIRGMSLTTTTAWPITAARTLAGRL